MIKKSRVVFLAMFSINVLHAEVYKWTDSKGVVHFSDKAHPNADKIELPAEQTYSLPAVPSDAVGDPKSAPTPITIESPNASSEQAPVEAAIIEPRGYTNVKILQPEDQATIRDNHGNIPVMIQTEPVLQKGDTIQIMLDGLPQGKPEVGTAFVLQGIDRGMHKITVNVLNEKNEIIKTSAPVTIFLQRPRVGMVPGTRR